MPLAIAQSTRRELRDAYGHELKVEILEGTAPCRLCLRIARAGERMILMSYNPFGGDYGPYSEVGPIFIHADECEPYEATSEVPPDFIGRELVLRAYNLRHAIQDSAIAPALDAPAVAARFFEDPDVAYIHARHTTYGCFDFKIERA